MKRIYTILPALVLILAGCTKDPFADFQYSPTNPEVGQTVYFENYSYDAVSYEWSFDDGTVTTIYNPTHQFLAAGTYNVQLKAFGKGGQMSVFSREITVTGVDPYADFGVYTYLPGEDGDVAVETDMVFVGEEVEFYNTSLDAASYEWDYGDGYGSEVVSPIYSYDTPGVYEVTLVANSYGSAYDTYTKTIEVVEGVNSALRITVLEYYDEYPVENASVILFGSVFDWENEIDASGEVFTTPLGKCVFEGLNNQRYYVDVLEDFHDNYALAAEDIGFIETQVLEPGYIHDFYAYVDYYAEGKKKMTLTRAGKKKLAQEQVSQKKSSEYRVKKRVTFSKER